MNTNPLQKYYRQPKIFLSLPSKGSYYPENNIQGDPLNLPVYGMTGMDEILFKTPDALFTGEAVVDVIKSCIPAITDPWSIPQTDIDSILIAIRIATYGENMPFGFKCSKCEEENEVELYLPNTLDYFQSLTFVPSISIGDIEIYFKPLTYRDQTQIALQSYQLQKKLFNISKEADEQEKTENLNQATKEINNIQYESFKKCLLGIEADGKLYTDQEIIDEWYTNTDRTYYKQIKDHLVETRNKWSLPDQITACSECGHENKIPVGFDNSNFFGDP